MYHVNHLQADDPHVISSLIWLLRAETNLKIPFGAIFGRALRLKC